VGWQGWNNVSYCSVAIVLSGFLYAAQSLRCLLRGRCVYVSSVDMIHSVRMKKKNVCEVVWVCGLMSV